jgi:hypothetical protein
LTVAKGPDESAATRTEERRRAAEHRAEAATRRAAVARRRAQELRNAGATRGATFHDHEAALHQRAAELHLQAARLQVQHAAELDDAAERHGMDPTGLRAIAANVRRTRDEAQLRSEQARTFAMRARERAETLRSRHPAGNDRA